MENGESQILSFETILNDYPFKLFRVSRKLTVFVTRWLNQIYTILCANVTWWSCLSNYVIANDVQHTFSFSLSCLYLGILVPPLLFVLHDLSQRHLHVVPQFLQQKKFLLRNANFVMLKLTQSSYLVVILDFARTVQRLSRNAQFVRWDTTESVRWDTT